MCRTSHAKLAAQLASAFVVMRRGGAAVAAERRPAGSSSRVEQPPSEPQKATREGKEPRGPRWEQRGRTGDGVIEMDFMREIRWPTRKPTLSSPALVRLRQALGSENVRHRYRSKRDATLLDNAPLYLDPNLLFLDNLSLISSDITK